jgi:hypothetical protein
MGRDKHYNPLLEKRLLSFFSEEEGRGWCCVDMGGMERFFASLSNADFRTAGFLLGERILPRCSVDGFWEVVYRLTEYNAKAFLVTSLKSLSLRSEAIDLHHSALQRFFCFLNAQQNGIDKQKFILWVLPLLKTPGDILYLFDVLEVTSPVVISDFLIHRGGTLCYYVLFLLLRKQEGDSDLPESICRRLMKQGDGLSFNVASVFKIYFGLDSIRGTFSLQLAPYELSRLEQSYEAFAKVVEG